MVSILSGLGSNSFWVGIIAFDIRENEMGAFKYLSYVRANQSSLYDNTINQFLLINKLDPVAHIAH